jgi:hypothetical protein
MLYPEKYRINHPLVEHAFVIPYQGRDLFVIANIHVSNSGAIWEHVSVTLRKANRCPNWPEMCFVKDLFFGEDTQCIQFHPMKKEYINLHPYCLHIWKMPFEVENMLEQFKTEKFA